MGGKHAVSVGSDQKFEIPESFSHPPEGMAGTPRPLPVP